MYLGWSLLIRVQSLILNEGENITAGVMEFSCLLPVKGKLNVYIYI